MMPLIVQQPPRWVQKTGDTNSGMLLQILADSRSVRLHFDTMFGEMGTRSDATAHQNDRALKSAGGYDDLPRGEGDGFTVAREACGLNATAGDHNMVEQRLCQYRQIWPPSHLGGQIRESGTGAVALVVKVDRGGKHAVHPGSVLILLHWVAHVGEYLRNRFCEPRPTGKVMALDRQRPAPAVPRL